MVNLKYFHDHKVDAEFIEGPELTLKLAILSYCQLATFT